MSYADEDTNKVFKASLFIGFGNNHILSLFLIEKGRNHMHIFVYLCY